MRSFSSMLFFNLIPNPDISSNEKDHYANLVPFLFHGDFGSTPPIPRQKSGTTKEDVRKGKGYYSNKRKISAKRDNDINIFFFSKNLLKRNAIKRQIWVYRGILQHRRRRGKFLGLSTRYFLPFFVRLGGYSHFWAEAGGGYSQNDVEQKMEQD